MKQIYLTVSPLLCLSRYPLRYVYGSLLQLLADLRGGRVLGELLALKEQRSYLEENLEESPLRESSLDKEPYVTAFKLWEALKKKFGRRAESRGYTK